MGPRSAAATKDDDVDDVALEGEDEQEDEENLPGDEEEEDDNMAVDDNEEEANAGGSKRRRRSRPSLMEESGMTEAERRALRHAQRKLHEEILEFNNSTANDPVAGSQSSSNNSNTNNNTNNLVQSIRLKNNALYKKVAFTREAVLDGENLDLLAKRAMEQVDRLVQVPRFDAQRLSRALRSKCSLRNGSFDWKTLGGEAGICFNALPSRVAFLNGPLQADYVPKPARQVHKRVPKQVEDDEEEEEVEDVKRSANQGKLSEVEHNIDQVKKILKKRCDQQYLDTMALLNQPEYDYLKKTLSPEDIAKWVTRHGQDVCAIQFLFNPQSFTQTVENLFYFSFLVKMNSAEILIRQDETEGTDKVHPIAAALASTRLPGPVIRFRSKKSKKTDGTVSPPNETAGGGAPATAARQAIVNLTMQSWRELCEAYGVTKGDLPHRVSRSNNDHEATSGRSSSAATAVAATKKKRRDHHDEENNNDDHDDQDENNEEEEAEVAAKAATRRQPKKRKVRASRVVVDEDDNEESD